MAWNLRLALFLALSLVAGTATARAGDDVSGKSPIFGKAKISPLTEVENKQVVGKGYYADLYGYYGILYSSYANQEGNVGYTYGDATSYYYAYYYSYYAAEYYYAAYVNQFNGT